jgi:P27 family predicted phage terminase small subunit
MNAPKTPPKGRRYARDGQTLRDAAEASKPVLPYPDDLPEDYKKLWLETVNTKPADYWTKQDIPLLELYCRTYFDMKRLNQEIEDEGEIITNAKGNPTINPKIMVRTVAEQRFLMLCSKLRAQPSARGNIVNEGSAVKRRRNAVDTARAAEGGDDGDDEGHGLLAGIGAGTPMQ